ncbi:Arginyl-tRNA--protein transferase 1 [Microbotryomycetes sp. JL201]|nr:Arginyl-tRNA--protein transferase 1 [Microbotryomycetes sp. JL201]
MSSLASTSSASSHYTASTYSTRADRRPAPSDDEVMSILQPLGYTTGSCGYCQTPSGKRKRTARSYGLEAPAFTPSKSQRQLLHRFANMCTRGARYGTPGWGDNFDELKNDGPSWETKADSLLSMAKSVTFEPPKQARLDDLDENEGSNTKNPRLSRSKHRAKSGGSIANASQPPFGRAADSSKSKGKGRAPAMSLEEMVHEGEYDQADPQHQFLHQFKFVLEEASFTEEKYNLFCRYQTKIHKEPENKVTRKGFKRFLVDSPLEIEDSGVADYRYGSHHGLYYVDGQLIALAVLDILPGAVSSVYLAWDPDWSGASLGKLSALREISMVREMHAAGLHDMTAYMMGFYIHSCPKMRYKGEYHPSSLLDPETNEYYPLQTCLAMLDTDDHAVFSRRSTARATGSASHTAPVSILRARNGAGDMSRTDAQAMTPVGHNTHVNEMDSASSGLATRDQSEDSMSEDQGEDSSDDPDANAVKWPDETPPGCLDPKKLPKDMLLKTTVLEHRMLVPLLFSSAWHNTEKQQEVRELLAATGEALAGRIAIYTG